jgi:5-methylthioribose kinase
MPMLIGIDAVNNLIALEDLGKTNDYSVCMI